MEIWLGILSSKYGTSYYADMTRRGAVDAMGMAIDELEGELAPTELEKLEKLKFETKWDEIECETIIYTVSVEKVPVSSPNAMLAEKLMLYAELSAEVERLENAIKKEVAALGQTVSVESGTFKVTATYGQRTAIDYAAVAAEITPPDNLVQKYTEPKTDWRKVVKEIAPPKDLLERFKKTYPPYVSLKVKNKEREG